MAYCIHVALPETCDGLIQAVHSRAFVEEHFAKAAPLVFEPNLDVMAARVALFVAIATLRALALPSDQMPDQIAPLPEELVGASRDAAHRIMTRAMADKATALVQERSTTQRKVMPVGTPLQANEQELTTSSVLLMHSPVMTPSPTPSPSQSIVMTLVSGGTVADYDVDTMTRIAFAVAEVAEVPRSDVRTTLTGGSVVITAFVTVDSTSAANQVLEHLQIKMNTKEKATVLLNIAMEADPRFELIVDGKSVDARVPTHPSNVPPQTKTEECTPGPQLEGPQCQYMSAGLAADVCSYVDWPVPFWGSDDWAKFLAARIKHYIDTQYTPSRYNGVTAECKDAMQHMMCASYFARCESPQPSIDYEAATIFPACGGHCALLKELKCPHAEAFNCGNMNCCPGKNNTCFSNLTSATWHGPIHEWRFKAGCLDRTGPAAVTKPCDDVAKPLKSISDAELAAEMQRRSELDAGKASLLELSFSAAGDLASYDEASRLQMGAAIASAAGLQAWDVAVDVTAGSVLVTARITVKGGTAGLAMAQAKLGKVFTSVEAASEWLGVTVLSMPSSRVLSLSDPAPTPALSVHTAPAPTPTTQHRLRGGTGVGAS